MKYSPLYLFLFAIFLLILIELFSSNDPDYIIFEQVSVYSLHKFIMYILSQWSQYVGEVLTK